MKEIETILNPRIIAIIGASEKEGKVGNVLMKKLIGFKGEIIPINPKHNEIFGKKAYSSIKKYPGKVDLAVIAIPAKEVKKAIKECGKKEIKNVIIISAGFSETGNAKLENKIIKIGKKLGMNILGPNCFGIANPSIGLDLTFSNNSARSGEIAFISQSGALWSYIADVSYSEKNHGFSGYVSLGNMADLEFADFIEYFERDNKTKKIVLYIEKLKDGRRFIDICKNSKKEIIAIKSGRTKIGSEATLSHTGSLATDAEVYKGVFKQAEIKEKKIFSEAFNISEEKIKLEGKNVSIVTNAGGAGALLSDRLSEGGYSVSPPIDVLGTGKAEDYRKIFDELAKKETDVIAVILTPQSMSQPEKTAEEIIKLSKIKKTAAFFLGAKSIEKSVKMLKKAKIPCYTNL